MSLNEPVKLLTTPWVPNVALMREVVDNLSLGYCPVCHYEGRITRPNGVVEACTHCRRHDVAWAPRARR